MAGKRPYASHYDPGPSSEPNRFKRHSFRRNGPGGSNNMNNIKTDETVFRILCPASKTGGVIGKGGNIIKSLRKETGAKIKIEESVQGSDERVIIISASEKDRDLDDDDNDTSTLSLDRDDRGVDDYAQGKEVISPAQLALFKVHTRILDADKYELDEEDEDEEMGEKVITRLLVPDNQVGCLLGRRGKIIEQMREETGSQIRILPREQLPLCALQSDEVLQVVGERMAVKRALYAVSSRLLDNPPKDRLQVAPFPHPSPFPPRCAPMYGGDPFLQGGNLLPQSPRMAPVVPHAHQNSSRNDAIEPAVYQLLRPSVDRSMSEIGSMGRQLVPLDEELIFRILCPVDKIPTIIGKGGSVIQALRDETGAKIKVADAVPGSDERVIIVSAVECPDDDLSPAQEAVFHIQDRMKDFDYDEGLVTRLLVPCHQVGCLLGKGGNIIMEMRKATRAGIRILSKEQLPKCALDNDEVVQIMGEIRVARDALVRVTSRLRANLYRDKADRLADMDQGSSFGGYGRRQRSPSPGHYSSSMSALSLQGNQSPGSPPPWLMQGGGMERGYHPGSGMASGSGMSSGIVTSSKVELLVPEAAILSVLGPNGSNLAQISKLSGAKLNVLSEGLYPGAHERLVEISGTPDQTNAAKNLVEAFILSGF